MDIVVVLFLLDLFLIFILGLVEGDLTFFLVTDE